MGIVEVKSDLNTLLKVNKMNAIPDGRDMYHSHEKNWDWLQCLYIMVSQPN